MPSCGHTRWLCLATQNQETCLEVSDRIRTLLDDLPNPDRQYPSVLTLIGNQSKARFLQKLSINVNGIRAHRFRGELHVALAPNSVSGNHPMLVIDVDLPSKAALPRSQRQQRCHEIIHRQFLQSSKNEELQSEEHIFTRLVIPHTDVLCLFAGDIGGVHRAVQVVTSWASMKPSHQGGFRPWLVVAVNSEAEEETFCGLAATLLAAMSNGITTSFASLRVLNLGRTTSRQNRLSVLTRELTNLCNVSREGRAQQSLLFTARHLAGLLHYGATKAMVDPAQSSNFILTARIDNPPAPDLVIHIRRFLDQCAAIPLENRIDFVPSAIASSLILDSYPPGMHDFQPREVFHELYKDTCKTALDTSELFSNHENGTALATKVLKSLENKFFSLFDSYVSCQSSKTLHQQQIASYVRSWKAIRSNETCLCCIRRQPRFRLECGHSFCECCIRTFAVQDELKPWLFRLGHCLLCGLLSAPASIQIRPETAGLRVLSIDGGGTRGRVPLEFLRVLQERVGLPLPIHENFDLVFGTSSVGAIITCALCINGWPVDKCIAAFESFARLAFKPRCSFRIPIITKLYELCWSMLADSRYSTIALEEALKSTFGSIRSMLDHSMADEKGILVGVPVTTIRDVRTFVFSNYNGIGRRGQSGHYFKPRTVEGLGVFQDGGLMYNNPASLAIREAAVLHPTTPGPSLVVSLGTGSLQSQPDTVVTSARFWRDSFFFRVFRAFMQYGSADRAWQQLLSHWEISKSSEVFRFDVEFKDVEPPLDDVESMPDMARNAFETISMSPVLDKLVLRIRAELFFFELDQIEPFRIINSTYQCSGAIFCRLAPDSDEAQELVAQFKQNHATFVIRGHHKSPDFTKLPNNSLTGPLLMKVAFQASSRAEPIMISLQEGIMQSPISGSPVSLQQLLDMQHLENRFGTPDHRKRTWPIVEPTPSKRRRRR
ncbi:uncharacterized protein B0I36DRAFT_254112 [Microdochium trichocladiopsis]|uniref:PNPLA domain-containing protein n=1 Tax=Microdochium trichocladiopsis TaxID=1682393 RepID=A0A9P8XWB7_9PEZI|nr:uncharacterized protein B0I36DRAFT_254112 [Microdochium trichocladiopsis]KAH7016325.1 hypothetical protein B0I36DRAFT_254112 [Microdochium trichocladiopsis]